MRHRAINKVAAVGTLAFHLRRQLPDGQPALDGARGVLPLIDAEVAAASEALARSFLPAPRREPAPVAVGEVVREVVRAWPARPPGVEIAAPANGDGAMVAIDASELAVAVGCLLENAVDAIAARPPGTVHLGWRRQGAGDDIEDVAVEVTDDGPGLGEVAPAGAREPFFSTRPGHAGVGLTIADRIARRWLGRLELERGEPGGVTARLVFPAALAPAQG
jgi:C4-dicarboxylate-specific signal transduction histidine kinase